MTDIICFTLFRVKCDFVGGFCTDLAKRIGNMKKFHCINFSGGPSVFCINYVLVVIFSNNSSFYFYSTRVGITVELWKAPVKCLNGGLIVTFTELHT